ncbi:MAG: AIR synthase-related protein [Candidatus Moraniibacteriota bacterium]
MSQDYAAAGVDYDFIDPVKRQAMGLATSTVANLDSLGIKAVPGTRGESYSAVELPGGAGYIAHVTECLGTKSSVAQAMYRLTGDPRCFTGLGQDTIAMAVNDILTGGWKPYEIQMYLAAGASDWFADTARAEALLDGWRRGCELAGCHWSGGETPALASIIYPDQIDLAASTVAWVPKGWPLIKGDVQSGDAIVILPSSGIHANGLSAARKIAERLPEGYLTQLPNERTFGETLLDPTHIYVNAVITCLQNGINIHYAVNVTGHGWRKLMRLQKPFEYVICHLPKPLPIFDFIQEQTGRDDRSMLEDFNMGGGFVLFLPQKEARQAIAIIEQYWFPGTILAGNVYDADQSQVNIVPKGIRFEASELAIR